MCKNINNVDFCLFLICVGALQVEMVQLRHLGRINGPLGTTLGELIYWLIHGWLSKLLLLRVKTRSNNNKTYSWRSSGEDSKPSFSLITAGIFPVYLDELSGEIFLGRVGCSASIMALTASNRKICYWQQLILTNYSLLMQHHLNNNAIRVLYNAPFITLSLAAVL